MLPLDFVNFRGRKNDEVLVFSLYFFGFFFIVHVKTQISPRLQF